MSRAAHRFNLAPMKPGADTGKSERITVLLLALLGAAHVFVFSAAFPFFSVNDEQAHFDLVMRYAKAEPPRGLSHTDEAALPFIVWFSSAEYLSTPKSQPGGHFAPPPWTLPAGEAARRLAPRARFWRDTVMNHEASQPPLYYALAAGWWKIGGLLPMSDGDRLLWLRLLNAVFLAALVWLAALAARNVFPENKFIRLAVPALTAFFPQSVFYAVNNDIASPLAFGAAFVLLLKFRGMETPTAKIGAATGLALAAAFLAKTSNLPLLAVAGFFLALKIFSLARRGKLRASFPALLVLFVTAALPAAGWMAWCKMNFGDLTGSNLKIQFLGWTEKPMAEWFHHPVFSGAGFWFFVKQNVATFWQGEELWHREPLAIPAVDLVYVALTLGALALTLAALLGRPPAFAAKQSAAQPRPQPCSRA